MCLREYLPAFVVSLALICPLFPTIRWMENVSLDVTAICFHPAEVRGQKVQEVKVFMSCQEKESPPDKSTVAATSPNLKKLKVSRAKSPVLKVRPIKSKAKSRKITKTRPRSKAEKQSI